ncbi:hypothetical protein N6H14_12675 [Paenibacillus sp. CC-CFT747]|nr:hypothetical protein N6H14_12675 [Paenibacillus sp. CC-CFT747]
MLKQVKLREDGLVEFRLAPGEGCLSCRVDYCTPDAGWKPAVLFPSLDPEEVLNGAGEQWEEAYEAGIVRFAPESERGKGPPLFYWNLYGMREWEGHTIPLRFTTLTEMGKVVERHNLKLTGSRALYLDDWEHYAGESGWNVRPSRFGTSVGMKRGRGSPALYCHPRPRGIRRVFRNGDGQRPLPR